MKTRFLGAFVHPMDAQSEGLDAVLDTLQDAGFNALATTPMLGFPMSGGTRIPELHIDGYDRLLTRPLWGRCELEVGFHRAIPMDEHRYSGTPYRPPGRGVAPDDLDVELPFRLVEEARRRGMATYVQTTPFVPPGVRDEDRPRLVDGSLVPPPHVAANACLNRPTARRYAAALVEETATAFPDIDGLFMDWVEYGAYRLEDHFTCFCGSCEAEAHACGLDWAAIVEDVAWLWQRLHMLDSDALMRSRRLLRRPAALMELAKRRPGLGQLLALKARSVASVYGEMRAVLDGAGRESTGLAARGWAPPWNLSSGMDYALLAEICSELTPKLFTFDYSALPRWYGESLRAWNPELGEAEIVAALLDWMDLPDRNETRDFARYRIPAPDELHHADLDSHRERMEDVLEMAAGRVPCRPFAHAYLPAPQWARMVSIIRDSRADGMWVQMYGYLSPDKLAILREHWTQEAS